MKHFLTVLLLLSLATVVQGAITIDGPTQCEVGETIALEVKGANFVLDSSSTIANIVAEVRKVQIQHENEILGVEMRMKIVPDGFQLTLEVEVEPQKEGVTFVFAIDRTNKDLATLPVAFHAIQVEEVPEPDPPVPPVPNEGPRYLLFLREKTPAEGDPKVSARWSSLITRLRKEQMEGLFPKHLVKDADDDAPEAAYVPYIQGKDPKTGEPYRKNDDPTPTLFIIDNEPPHQILWHGPSPSTIQDLKAKVTEYGG